MAFLWEGIYGSGADLEIQRVETFNRSKVLRVLLGIARSETEDHCHARLVCSNEFGDGVADEQHRLRLGLQGCGDFSIALGVILGPRARIKPMAKDRAQVA